MWSVVKWPEWWKTSTTSTQKTPLKCRTRHTYKKYPLFCTLTGHDDAHLLRSHWRHRHTFQRCSWNVNKNQNLKKKSHICGWHIYSLTDWSNKPTRHSLDALQHLHQLRLLVWSHAGQHGGFQGELQHPRAERQSIAATCKQWRNITFYISSKSNRRRMQRFCFSCNFILPCVSPLLI